MLVAGYSGWKPGFLGFTLLGVAMASPLQAQESRVSSFSADVEPAENAAATVAVPAAVPAPAADQPAAPDVAGPTVSGADLVEPALAPESASPADQVIEAPKLTVIQIEILEPLGSKLSTSLDTFSIRLAAPLMIDGVEIIPAGTMGGGEVVHAKKAGGMGAPGELILAARFLDLDGRMIRLRSMKVGIEEPESRVNTVNNISTAAAATVAPLALVGFFIKGGQIDIPAGTLATAKLAENFSITMPAEQTIVAAQPEESPTETGLEKIGGAKLSSAAGGSPTENTKLSMEGTE